MSNVTPRPPSLGSWGKRPSDGVGVRLGMAPCRQAGWPGRVTGGVRLASGLGGGLVGGAGTGGGVGSRVTCRAFVGLIVGIASGLINRSRNSGNVLSAT